MGPPRSKLGTSSMGRACPERSARSPSPAARNSIVASPAAQVDSRPMERTGRVPMRSGSSRRRAVPSRLVLVDPSRSTARVPLTSPAIAVSPISVIGSSEVTSRSARYRAVPAPPGSKASVPETRPPPFVATSTEALGSWVVPVTSTSALRRASGAAEFPRKACRGARGRFVATSRKSRVSASSVGASTRLPERGSTMSPAPSTLPSGAVIVRVSREIRLCASRPAARMSSGATADSVGRSGTSTRAVAESRISERPSDRLRSCRATWRPDQVTLVAAHISETVAVPGAAACSESDEGALALCSALPSGAAGVLSWPMAPSIRREPSDSAHGSDADCGDAERPGDAPDSPIAPSPRRTSDVRAPTTSTSFSRIRRDRSGRRS